VYSTSSSLVNLAVTIYIAYRLFNPSEKRNTTFMVIGLLLGVVGTVFFLGDGDHADKNYSIIHSVWHICSYGALYFSVRSIRSDTDIMKLRRPRIEFSRKIEFGKLAYQ